MISKEIHFQNFGKVKDAHIRMRPFTMITGHNSSGKSFITRALYSVFYTLNQDLMAKFLNSTIQTISSAISSISEHLYRKSSKDIQDLENIENELFNLRLEISEKFIEANITQEIEILLSLQPLIADLENKISDFSKRLKKGQGKKFESVKSFFGTIEFELHQLANSAKNWIRLYALALKQDLKQSFIANFQINSLSQLSFLSNKAEIDIDNNQIFIENNELGWESLKLSMISDLQSFYNVVYLESPIYFKLRNTLKEARFQHSIFSRRNSINQVPKFFYDTDRLINSQFIEDNIPKELIDIIKKIEKGIDGKLSIDSRDNIVFQDNELPNIEIPFNLVSSGISNLGIIALLLKKNILTKGSFLFIDEPELNLHTEWQHLMLEVLVDLSLAGVNVMVASHSLDMVLRLQNIVENYEDQDSIEKLFALNRLAKNGTTFESKGILQDIRDAKADLGKPYVDLLKQRLP